MKKALLELDLRLARDDEARAIAELSRDEVERGLGWRWTPARVAESIRAPDTNVLVARLGGPLVGFGIMSYGLDAAHLELFAVDRRFRRHGVGTSLLRWLEKPAIVVGARVIWLEVRAGNRAAQAFYARLGYRRVAALPGYYEGRETAIRMGRELGRP